LFRFKRKSQEGSDFRKVPTLLLWDIHPGAFLQQQNVKYFGTNLYPGIIIINIFLITQMIN
jgi:hypothetical protein